MISASPRWEALFVSIHRKGVFLTAGGSVVDLKEIYVVPDPTIDPPQDGRRNVRLYPYGTRFGTHKVHGLSDDEVEILKSVAESNQQLLNQECYDLAEQDLEKLSECLTMRRHLELQAL